jgi:murein DD-endopeptidase MepM/ murein hydrolase activator NlpD
MTLLTEAQIMGGQPSGRPAIVPSTPPADGPVATSSAIDGFNYDDPGVLTASGGQGNKSGIIYAPGIRFPVEKAPTFLGSMVYGYGGSKSPEKNRSWKDRRNYRYPWQDNFCEPREYRTSLCPSGKGHQGVDIRPARAPLKRERIYWAVAAEDGVIGAARGYTVTLLGNSGTRYDYLHLEMAQLSVKQGARVKAGDKIGLISDNFGKTVTPVHLHFEIRQFVPGKGVIPVPPYMSLVRAYERM